MALSSGNKKLLWGIGLGLVVGFFIGGLIFGFSSETSLETAGERRDTTDSNAVADNVTLDASGSALRAIEETRQVLDAGVLVTDDIVHVKDQRAGSEVFISRVELSAPGWAAVHELVAGEPTTILGAARFDAGVYQGTVKLLRPLVVGQTYYVTLWHDDGDKIFNHERDSRLSLSVGMPFEVF